MEAWAVRLDSPAHFTAFVLRGDAEVSVRTWVCLRAADSLPPVSWLGSWSCADGADADKVRQLLEVIRASIGEPVLIGPYGPTMKAPVFLDPWESWGGGTPRPLLGVRLWEAEPRIQEVDAASLDFSDGGVEVEL